MTTVDNIILTEQIPEDTPDWFIEAMAEQRAFAECFRRIKELQVENDRLRAALEAIVRDRAIYNMQRSSVRVAEKLLGQRAEALNKHPGNTEDDPG